MVIDEEPYILTVIYNTILDGRLCPSAPYTHCCTNWKVETNVNVNL